MATSKQKIGEYVRGLIKSGKHTPARMVTMASKKFPDSQVDEKHIAWYKWDMKKKGEIGKDHQVKSGRTPAKKKIATKPKAKAA